MFLNLDVCDDVLHEIIPSLKEDRELLARFILSGKESIIGLKRMINKAETIELAFIIFDPFNAFLSSFYYLIKFDEVS